MLLTFKSKFPFGDRPDTNFATKITWGRKVHTFRRGIRIKPGDKLHMWINSPRNLTMNPYRFNPSVDQVDFWFDIPNNRIIGSELLKGYGFHGCPSFDYIPIARAVECVIIKPYSPDYASITIMEDKTFSFPSLHFDHGLTERFAFSDGFDSYNQMTEFFHSEIRRQKISQIAGQIVHWSERTIYDPTTAQIFQPGKIKFQNVK